LPPHAATRIMTAIDLTPPSGRNHSFTFPA
jgi:hypothetical protein